MSVIFPKPYAKFEHELSKMYPLFMLELSEISAVLKAEGKQLDDIDAAISQVAANQHISTADEATISQYEAWLNVKSDKSRTLEERRSLVLSLYVGSGKLSATKLKEALRAFTGADSNIYLKQTDAAGNNTLFIEMQRGSNADISYSDIENVLAKNIPAHIAYKVYITYTTAIAISKRSTHYKHDYRICGLEPDVALIGKKQTRTSVTESDAAAESYSTNYIYCGTTFAGTV